MNVDKMQLLIFCYAHIRDNLTQDLRSIFKIKLSFILPAHLPKHCRCHFVTKVFKYKVVKVCRGSDGEAPDISDGGE